MGKRIGGTFTGVLLASVAALPAWGQGNGLVGEYYNSNNLTGAVVDTRFNQAPIDVDYVAAGPGGAVTAVDNFSTRWRGEVEGPSTETVTFQVQADDLGRLFLNGAQLVASNNNTAQGTFPMTAGQRYQIMLEHQENGGGARIHLRWSIPSQGGAFVPVPAAFLHSPAAVPALPTIGPSNGGVGPLAVTLATATPDAQIWYTLNDSDPGLTQPSANPSAFLYSGPFPLTIYARVRARAYLGGVSSGELRSNAFGPPLDPLPFVPPVTGGVYFRYYHLNNPQVVPDFEPLLPQRRGFINAFSIAPTPARDRNDGFGFKFVGYVNIPSDGVWTFSSGSDDGSKLHIGPYEVVNNDGLHGAPGPQPTGSISLKAGWHPIAVSMFENGGGEGLTVQWQPPGGALAAIPAASLGSDAVAAAPTATPTGGTFTGSQVVTLQTATAGATILYTLDGNPPDERSAAGEVASGGTVTLTATTRLRALAVAPGMLPSDVVNAAFTLASAQPTTVAAAAIPTEVVIVFDKPVTAPTATDPANYLIDNGATVSGAVLMPRTAALRGHWRFDDLLGTDSTANANTGTFPLGGTNDLVDKPTVAFADPASLVLDGTDDHFVIPDSASLTPGFSSFTVALWIKPADTTSRRLVNKWDPAAVDKGWIMDINSTAGNLRFRVDDGGNNTDLNVGAGIVANQWQHVVGRCDRLQNRLTIFRNGVQIATADMATGFNDVNVAMPIRLGRLESPIGTPSGNHYSGRVDDFRFYGTALTNAEIAALAGTALVPGLEQVSCTVRLSTSTLAAGTGYTLTVRNVQDWTGVAIPAAGIPFPFVYRPTGTIARELYTGPGGVAVADLARNAVFPDAPNGGNRPTLFEAPSDFADNYGTRMRGYFIPNASGPWRFSVASDDHSSLWLSPDADPAGKVLISRCNDWSAIRDYADANITQSAPIDLVAGQKYYIEALQKEGGGGDNFSVAAIQGVNPIPAQSLPIAGTMLAPYDEAIVVLSGPFSRRVRAGQPASFTVGVTGAGPRTFQWTKDGTNVPGATGQTFTIAAAAAADAGAYRVVVTNGSNSVTSGPAALVVVPLPPPPTLTSVTPALGPTSGGQGLFLTGTDLAFAETGVAVGGVAAANVVTFLDGLHAFVLAPPHAAGPVDVVASAPGGSATAAAAFTYYGAPSVASATPAAGPVAGGQTVTITGGSFVPGQTSVRFGALAATGVAVTAFGSLTAVSPPQAAGAVDVVVETPFGLATLAGGYTYHDPPTIASITPADGPSTGGQAVVIGGTNFVVSNTTVVFDASPASITNVTAAAVAAVTPPHAAGAVVVTVTTPGGQATVGYTYHDPPAISTILPNAGPAAGGQAVVLTGQRFVPGLTTVSLGGSAVAVGATTAGQIDGVTSAHAAGVVDVVVVTPGGTATLALGYQYYVAPAVTSFTPTAGPSAGGQLVTVSGTQFVPGLTTVDFGGAPGLNVAVAAGGTSLTVNAPLHAAGATALTVSTPGGSSAGPVAYTYHDPPAVSSASPPTGTTQGGVTITLVGANFVAGQTTVSFGGTPGTDVVVGGPGSLTVTVPSHPEGAVDVVVVTPGGSVTAVGAFTYSGPFISAVNPAAGPVAGGQSVTITGSGFLAGAAVTFGGAAATVVGVTPTSIQVTAPPGAAPGAVAVSVTTSAGSYSAGNAYSYVGPPQVSGVSPDRGPAIGGQTVTITGSSFAAGFTGVTFGGTAATLQSVGFSQIVVTTPAHAAGTVDVVVTTFGNQTATASGAYTFVPPPGLTSIVPNRGSSAGGSPVAVSGSVFEPGATALGLGGSPASAVIVAPGGASLTAVTGPRSAGTVNAVVTTFGLQSATLPGGFTYVDPATATDLALTLVASNTAPSVGQQVTFTIQVSNSGALGATGVRVSELLPVGLGLVSASPSQGAYTAASGEWVVGSLAGGAQATLTIVALVESDAALTNSAEVVAADLPDLDSTPGNGVVGEDDLASVDLAASLSVATQGPLPAATSGARFHLPFRATGGRAPLTWSLQSGTLPFNLDPRSGVVSGIAPDVASPTLFDFSLEVRDSQSSPSTDVASFSLIVSPPSAGTPIVQIVPAPGAGVVGRPYAHTFMAVEGSPPYVWTLAGGSLPAGLFLNARTGELAGTPSAPGSAAFTLRATDSAGLQATQGFGIDSAGDPIRILFSPLPSAAVGAPFHAELASEGGLGPTMSWTVSGGALPGGLSLVPNGRRAALTGTPTAAGSFAFTLRLVDTGQPGVEDAKSLLITVLDAAAAAALAPAITTASLPPGRAARPYGTRLAATGGTGPYAWSIDAGALPAGLSLETATGAITGIPAEDGTFAFSVRVDAGSVLAVRRFMLVIRPAVEILTATPMPAAIRGEAYALRLLARGGILPYRWSVTSGTLPAGLTLSTTSGVIAGLPAGGGATFTVAAVDAENGGGSRVVTLNVVDPTAGLAVATTVLPFAEAGVPYSTALTPIGGTGPYAWALASGTLPGWSVLDGAFGSLSGLPAGAGSIALSFQASDASGPPPATATSNSLDLEVLGPFSIGAAAITQAQEFQPYSASLSATGAHGTAFWSVLEGTLPSGLSLDATTGAIAGTPEEDGDFPIRVEATDAAGRTARADVAFRVRAGSPPSAGGSGGGGGGGCGATASPSAGTGALALLGLLLATVSGNRRIRNYPNRHNKC